MKRMAIQLFGHLRTFKHTFPYFKVNVVDANIEDGWEIDVFIHTWDQLDHNTISYREDGSSTLQKVSEDDVALLKELYNPKGMLITPQVEYEETIITEKIDLCKRSIKGCVNMAFTQYSGSKLRREYESESGVSYDYVIVTRPDVLFKKPLKLEKILYLYKKLDFKELQDGLYYAYNPFRGRFGVEDPRIIAGSDLIYFGAPSNTDKATSLYEDFEDNIDPNDFYCFEVWQMNFWMKTGLRPLQMNYIFGNDWSVLYKESLPHIGDIVGKRNLEMKGDCKVKVYFFGIPILKIRRSGIKTKWYFLSFIPFLKIEKTSNA